MIKRVKEIKNVGVFSNFDCGGRVDFNETTLFFGYNCCGKTTFCDILRSIKENNSKILESRKTISSEGSGKQKVIVNFFDGKKEKEVKYSNLNWEYVVDFFKEYNIEIFDSNFIDKNIFTGLSIERKNKENVTDFILGEENVKTATKISKLKKERTNFNKKIKKLKDNLGSIIKRRNIDFSIQELSELPQKDNLDELETEIKKVKEEYDRIERIKNRYESILNIKTPKTIEFNIEIIPIFEKINDIFEDTFEELNEEIQEQILFHIENNFCKKDDEIESWIRKGATKYSDPQISKCPFCGQDIKDDARELMDLYIKYYNRKYQEFVSEVKNSLEKLFKDLQKKLSKMSSFPKKNIEIFEEYSDFLYKDEYKKKIKDLKIIVSDIDKKIDNIRLETNNSLEKCKRKIGQKNNKPYKKVVPLSYSKLDNLVKDVRDSIQKYSKIEDDIISEIRNFKKEIKEKKYNDKLTTLAKKINKLKGIKLRCERDAEISEYISKKKQVKIINDNLDHLDKKLKKQRMKFLSKYFKEINRMFCLFGSDNYEIKYNISKKGYKPVVELEIFFNGVDIDPENIEHVFSDSDRRALALSIFCAKINLLPREEKNKLIIVMDDPVTSFDENRMSNSIDYITA